MITLCTKNYRIGSDLLENEVVTVFLARSVDCMFWFSCLCSIPTAWHCEYILLQIVLCFCCLLLRCL